MSFLGREGIGRWFGIIHRYHLWVPAMIDMPKFTMSHSSRIYCPITSPPYVVYPFILLGTHAYTISHDVI